MTITAAKAFSREKMKKWLESPNDFDFSWLKVYDKIWVISVSSPGYELLFKKPQENVLTLVFDDIVGPSDDSTEGWVRKLFKSKHQEQEHQKHIYFSQGMARKVLEFVIKANDNNSKDLLLVNCHAGISRSGAIVEFAKSLFGLDQKKFEVMNPRIAPNPWVLQLLQTELMFQK